MLLGLGEHGEDARAGAGDVLPFLRAGDVVILGGGIWYRAGSVEKEAGVAATITPEVTAAARRRGVALLWMETSAQHFPSADGRFKGPGYWYGGYGNDDAARKRGCTPLKSTGYRMLEARASATAAALRRSGVAIVSSMRASWRAHDQHLANKTAHIKRKAARGFDCTHFCTPSAALDDTVVAISRALAEVLEVAGVQSNDNRPKATPPAPISFEEGGGGGVSVAERLRDPRRRARGRTGHVALRPVRHHLHVRARQRGGR